MPSLPRRAFTLVELLVVVAIIGILASIAVANMLQAQTRARVAAAEESQRVLAVGLEMFHVDNGSYPFGLNPFVHPTAVVATWQLTTPVAHLSQVPLDVFHEEQPFGEPGGPFGPGGRYMKYLDDPIINEYWILWSYGPDRAMSFEERHYDPTNGIISPGDIYRVGSVK